MGTERATLRVRRGEQTYGPMTLEKFEELIARGRLQETDLVSEEKGPWVPLKVWQGQRATRSDNGPLFDDEPLFSGPAEFDPNYVPLSDVEVPARSGTSSGAVPVPQAKSTETRSGAPLSLEGSGELKPDEEPRRRRSAGKSGSAPARPSTGAMKTPPASASAKSRPSSASMPASRSVDEAGMDALLQSLADDARKAPTATPQRKLPPRRS